MNGLLNIYQERRVERCEVMGKKLKWDRRDNSASVAWVPGFRYVVWPDGALSGHGNTEKHESVIAAKAAAQEHYNQHLKEVR